MNEDTFNTVSTDYIQSIGAGLDDVLTEIIEACARWAWSDAWAYENEHRAQQNDPSIEWVNVSGQDILDIAPPTGEPALAATRALFTKLMRQDAFAFYLMRTYQHGEAEALGYAIAADSRGHDSDLADLLVPHPQGKTLEIPRDLEHECWETFAPIIR